mmetsp:Transcript_26124/g.52386  ORF Transcript_26124/g.52386 Transcript_26124/m.52386 type:complete len:125 (+) Transcript_26124:1609-1983(+)
MILAVTPSLPAERGVGGGVSCHIALRTADGREASATNAFTYLRPNGHGYALACKAALDFDEFELAIPKIIAVYLCLWPYVLIAIVAFSMLRCSWMAWRQRQILGRMIARSRSHTVREVRMEFPL